MISEPLAHFLSANKVAKVTIIRPASRVVMKNTCHVLGEASGRNMELLNTETGKDSFLLWKQ